MTLTEAILAIVQPEDTSEVLALVILLGGSFLLGIILFWLLFYLPHTIRLRRETEEQKEQLQTMDKRYQDLNEDYRIQAERLKNIEHEAASTHNELVNQTNKGITWRNEIEELNAEMVRVKKSEDLAKEELTELKRLYKYAQAEITESEKLATTAQAAQTQLQTQVDQNKQYIASLEADKKRLNDQNVHLREEYDQMHIESEEYRKDLQTALSQMQQLQNEIRDLQNEINQLEGVRQHNDTLQDQVQALNQQLSEVDSQRTQLDQQLSVYTNQEETQRQQQQAEIQQLDDTLALAQRNMEGNPFFDDLKPEDLIEDAQKLQENLQQQPQGRGLDENMFQDQVEETVEIEDDEKEALERMLEEAQRAMNMPGMYGDLDPNALVEQAEKEQLTDEERIARMLQQVEAHMENSDLTREFDTRELVEDPEQLERNLSEMDLQAQTRSLEPEEEPVVVEQHEQDAMKRALEYAGTAFNSEGFYGTMSPEKLMENPNSDMTMTEPVLVFDPKYKTDIEKAVVAEIGKSVPRATEEQKNDLKRINGIGTFIEQKLNHLGIFTYEQVSHFDDNFIAKLVAAIGFAGDAIHRDNWVEQARQLVAQQKIQNLTSDLDKNRKNLN